VAVSAEPFESYRPLLFTVAYQMTGSASVAEDLVQDTYLRYQQAQGVKQAPSSTPPESIRSLKSYLTTITTRLALDYLKSARATREQYIGDWLPEPLLTDPATLPAEVAEREETISLAFLVLLETLSPPERAVFVLREVFDFGYDEIAAMLNKSVAASRQIFHRAQGRLATKQRHFSVSREQQQALVAGFLDASKRGEFDHLLRALADDAILWGDGGGKASSITHPLLGSDRVARFFVGLFRKGATMEIDLRVALVEANGAPAFLIWENEVLATAMVFITDGDRIVRVYSQRNPDKLAYLAAQIGQPPPPISP
jgi:RNA polymerase sigma-70 factor, ECF subfamily